ncbi:MAG TPA: hypothetical protein VFQ53_04550 [Kofleriaceae bacterium]|nr:hypothetical protein [Kofleriaceae bacterium]
MRVRFYQHERDGVYDATIHSNESDADFIIDASLFEEYKAAYIALDEIRRRIEVEGQPVSNWALDVAGANKTRLPPPNPPLARLTSEQRSDLRWVREFVVTRSEEGTKRLAEVLELLKVLAKEP